MDVVILDANTHERLLTAEQVCSLLDISSVTWRAYVSRGQAPKAVGSINRATPLWREVDVVRYRDGRKRV